MTKLKPCPFCGGEVSIALCGEGFDAWWFIMRGHGENACKCRLLMDSEQFNKDSEIADFVADDLIAAWNSRTGKDINVATNNAVPVVRCGECKYFMEYRSGFIPDVEKANGDCFIRLMNSGDKQFLAVKYSDYCSYGAKMEVKE